MKHYRLINALGFGAGLILGSYALSSANAAQPTLDWRAIILTLSCTPFAFLFVVGIQLIRKDPKYSKSMITIFKPLSVLLLGVGIGALATGFYYGELGPSSYFYLVIGVGLLMGVFVANLIYKVRFANAL
ncbi:MAG: hypothetical protein ACE1Y1_06705 [Nitrosomonadaceae bacterium]